MRTGRAGAAAKAGHDLLLHVTAWQATLEVEGGAAGSSLVLDADATSMRVREGTGGMQALGDDDKANIEQTIDDEVLKGQAIGFRSTSVEVAGDDGRLEVSGDLTLSGTTHPIAFDVAVDADGIAARHRRRQAERLGHEAVLGPVRSLEGRGRGRGHDRRFHPFGRSSARDRGALRPRSVARRRRLRAPVLDPAVSSFLWALFFFGYLVLGMAAVGVSFAIALILALAAAVAIFAFVRTRGGEPEGADQSR